MNPNVFAVVTLIGYTLAVARVTRLINADTILDPMRLAVGNRVLEARSVIQEHRMTGLGDPHRVALWEGRLRRRATFFKFLQCPWCIGMWVALLTTWAPMLLLGWFAWPWFHAALAYLGIVLAVSHLVGVAARFADTEEIDVEDVADDEDDDSTADR